MGKDAAIIRNELRVRLGQIARELGREVYPDGLSSDTKFSELEKVAGTLGDEIARQLIETPVRGLSRLVRGGIVRMPRVRGAFFPGPRSTPRAHDHARRRRLEPTRRILYPLSAGFFSLRTKRWY